MTHEKAIEKILEIASRAELAESMELPAALVREIGDALSSPPTRSARDEAIERALIGLSNWTAEHLEATCPGCYDEFDRNPDCKHGLDKFKEYQESVKALAMPKGEVRQPITPNTTDPEGKKFWEGVERGAAEYDAIPEDLKGRLGSREPKKEGGGDTDKG